MKYIALCSVVLLALSACASTDWPEHATSQVMSDTPDHFLAIDPATGKTFALSGPECRNPLVDPRDGTRLTLIQSLGGVGDYRVLPSRYGVSDSSLLRVRCSDGQAIGIVPAP